MMIYNASRATFQIGKFSFESMTLYTFSAFENSKYSYCWKWRCEREVMAMELSGNLEWE